jgi:hypothetical protein
MKTIYRYSRRKYLFNSNFGIEKIFMAAVYEMFCYDSASAKSQRFMYWLDFYQLLLSIAAVLNNLVFFVVKIDHQCNNSQNILH